MKLLSIIVLGLLFKMAAHAQGIKFDDRLSWKQIKEKAKTEHKAIFLDCFATWCEPCREMEKEVFTEKKVAEYYNENFICVRVQMDRTSLDDPAVKSWYNDAARIHNDYTITAYPSFLYFSSEAEPLHKAVGYKNVEGFIEQGKDAFDPDKQFYAILKNFQPGKLDTAEMKGLARAYEFNKDLSGKIALDYLTRIPRSKLGSEDNLLFMESFQDAPGITDVAMIYINGLTKQYFIKKKNLEFLSALKTQESVKAIVANYLGHLSAPELGKKANLQLMIAFEKTPKVRDLARNYIGQFSQAKKYTPESINVTATFTDSPADRSFALFFKHPEKVDAIMKQPGFASRVVDYFILKSEINPVVSTTKDGNLPKFDSVYQLVKIKYGKSYADRTILIAKVSYYKYRTTKYNTDWDTYLDLAIEKEKKYGMDTLSFWGRFALNNFAYTDVLFHSSKLEQLNAAINWMAAVAIKKDDKEYTSRDYGYLDTYANLLYKAGRKEEALKWELKASSALPNDKGIQEAYRKMLAGESTWAKP